ncbi:centrosomal protein of 152 kDa-like isoform X2 [Polyodon spathula]|uniref:centrosomal protein of 152 kDa-like isoform X2 n=1 Tax=Polyodon spathula TaxID=7913 RepID=UPI001B7DBBE1|nr:centrosomal protein of 152 kDa-like isoform X2 [Polyodon spathula]
MSIDFDSAALQTQHEEEEYDREDYAREQELHKLLTDLPDDMLEDSRDVSSPELNYSGCSANGTSGRPPQTWDLNNRQGVISTGGVDYEDGYIQDQYHEEYFNRNGNEHVNGHVNHGDPHGNGWSEQQEGENDHGYMYNHMGYEYLNTDAQVAAGSKDYSIDERFEQDPYVQTNPYHPLGPYQQHAERPREAFNHDDQSVQSQQYQGFTETGNVGDKPMDGYKVNYNRYLPAVQPEIFNAEVNNKDAKFEQMQIEFLNPGTNSAETQQIAQFQVLYKARGRQLEELQQKLEDCGRDMRYLNHQLAIAKDEKEGLALTLQESRKLIKDGKEKEVQLSGQIKALEFQVQTLTAKEEKNLEKQKTAEAALDSMQQQMMELCRSESLTRAREQHESILTALKEKHEDKVLALQQKLDAQSHALEEQKEICHRLQEQIKQQERQQEEAKLEKVEIINRLAKSLEESQQQCTNLLQTGTVQELNQLRFQLQQAQSAKNISDSMNKSLQEELGELKEQITLYESAGKFGVLSADPCGDSEAPMSDSYVELGIKNVNWKSTKFHSTSSVGRTDKSMSKDDMIMELKAELERFLGSFKVKRQKITQLQDELKQSQRQMQELKTQLEKAEKNAKDHEVRENSLEKHLETSVTDKAVKEEVERLQRENQALQQVIEKLRHQVKELRNSKETLKSANQELCTEMRKMMQDFDQDKQETTERFEKTHQQHREDIVNHLRGELLQEHEFEKEQLTQLYEEKIHSLEIKLSDLNQEMAGVQECYITVCKEKNLLEEDLRRKLEQEMALKENELKTQLSEENKRSLESFKSELEEKHRIFKATTKDQLMKEKKADLKQQVNAQVALAKISWQEEQKHVTEEAILKAVQEVEQEWSQRLQKSINDIKHERLTDKREQACQTEQSSDAGGIPEEEVEEKMKAQRLKLQQEAEACQAVAVKEAMKKAQGELEKKHQENVAKQVETAVSNAYTRWCNELNALPEYKASLQSEKEKWEKEHEQDLAKQISTVLKAAEGRWKKTHLKEIDRMEASMKNTELQEKVLSLQRNLDHQKEEEAVLIKAELAKAHAQWNREKQEEINKIHEANEKDYRAFLDEHRSKLNEVITVAKEDFERQKKELIIRKETDFKQILDRKQKEWSTQQVVKTEREKRQIEDEIFIELEVLLGEVKELLVKDPNSPSRVSDKLSSTQRQPRNQYFGKLKACLVSTCKDVVSKVMDISKQEWEKESEEKLCCALREEKLRHEQEMKAKVELGIHHNGQEQEKEELLSCSKHCIQKLEKSQKQCHDLRRNLEKACRQLQQTVRENKANVHKIKADCEEAIKKEREEGLRRVQEVKASRKTASTGSQTEDKPCIQKGLEEIREQYLRAVCKIRGDMLRYIQESKERAAEMIRVEVLRERQETARKMRTYYLTCLQQLLEDGGKKEGAEKKIMNAASKLAAMAKVLETPAPNRKCNKKDAVTGSIRSSESAAVNTRIIEENSFCAVLDHKPKYSASKFPSGDADQPNTQAADKDTLHSHFVQRCNVTATKKNVSEDISAQVERNDYLSGVDQTGVFSHFKDVNRKLYSSAGQKNKDITCNSAVYHSQVNFGHTHLFNTVDSFGDTVSTHVTLRNQSKDMVPKGLDHCQSENCFAAESMSNLFDVQETPVRDGGASDWSAVSLGMKLESNFPPSLYSANKTEPTRKHTTDIPLAVSSVSNTDDIYMPGTDFVPESHSVTPKCVPDVLSKPKSKTYQDPNAVGLHLPFTKKREPIPGSEVEKVYRLYPNNLFSEITAAQQDSGFDSPLLQK